MKLTRIVRERLKAAGWFEGRDASCLLQSWLNKLSREGHFRASEAARAALREFGGLTVEQSGQGVDFSLETFSFNPEAAIFEEDRFGRFKEYAGSHLFPLGEIEVENAFIAISETGEVYLLMDEIHLVGSDIYSAISNLVEGKGPTTDQ